MQIQEQLQIRKQKGYEIAQKGNVKLNGNKWIVPSQSSSKTYEVSLRIDKSVCNCPDFAERGIKCKHIFAVEITISKTVNRDGSITETTTIRKTYPQNWSIYNKNQEQEKAKFMELLKDLLENVPEPSYTFGRPQVPIRDLLFASTLKVYSQFSIRRFKSDLQVAKEKEFVEQMPSRSSISDFMQGEDLTLILKKLIVLSSLPLKEVESKFAVDSTGFRTTKFNDYCREKHGIKKQHDWLKLHAICGVKTNIITGVEIGEEHHSSDSPQFIPLVKATFDNGFDIDEVSADKAYSARDNIGYVSEIGATAYIPYRINATGKPRGKSHMWRKMYHYYMLNRDEFLQHYHLRSNIESTFAMMKAKFNDMIKSKSKTAQINELLLKVLCHNIVVVNNELNNINLNIS
jgi:transposase